MSNDHKLFEPFNLNAIHLKNRAVLAPLTRSRATQDHIPTDIMATYYQQRAGAGLIITEGTSPSINGAGYARIPGIYNETQTEAWKPVTKAVREHDAKIFIQLMHTGRITHPANLEKGGIVLSPSPIAASNTKMYVDGQGELELPVPREMTQEDIQTAISEFVKASENAIVAGFDGVELHGANGYLLEQFLNPAGNKRTDSYGGSTENRTRFVIELAEKVASAIGKEKVGIRLSPHGAFNEIVPFDEEKETFVYLAKKLGEIGVTYIHLVDHSSMGTPPLPKGLKESIRGSFGGTIIISGGYDFERAEQDLEEGLGHLVAFGRPFISNPDLLKRFKLGAEITSPDPSTFYSPGEKGYIDYPTLEG
ncbi:MAG: alkene reductase [Bacteroidota bacterium]